MEQNSSRCAKPDPNSAQDARASDSFDSTPWSVVLRARDKSTPEARSALATLCQAYWYPLYTFIRKRSSSADDAEELTQEFLARLLEKGFGSDI